MDKFFSDEISNKNILGEIIICCEICTRVVLLRNQTIYQDCKHLKQPGVGKNI